MDREPEELQFLGLVGILTESTKLITSQRRLFSQITSTLILPLSLLFLIHIHISHALFTRIDSDETALELTPPNSPSESRLLSLLTSDWTLFFLFKALYLLFLLVFALLSTSAVVYTIASLFTAKDITFSKLFSVVPKVWKRLMITFLWAFLLLFSYNLLALLLFLALALIFGPNSFGILLAVCLLFAYLAGLIWISVVWHLASVVSVLEDACGIHAMRKSRELIRGKTPVAVGVFLLLNLAFILIEFGFRKLVVDGRTGLGLVWRFGYGLLMLGLLMVVILLGLVVQTVVYFVCKSYHHESIDKSSLADHLEVYMGEYVPLKARDVQLEQFHV